MTAVCVHIVHKAALSPLSQQEVPAAENLALVSYISKQSFVLYVLSPPALCSPKTEEENTKILKLEKKNEKYEKKKRDTTATQRINVK